MNTFVLAAIIASATFGLASANKDECSPKIMMFVNAKNNCPAECSTGMDECITCVMEGMGFGTDVGAFTNAENHILFDDHANFNSRDCLATMEGFVKEGAFDEDSFKDLIDQLEGKTLAQVLLDSADKFQLYTLFVAADTCIDDAGCFDSA